MTGYGESRLSLAGQVNLLCRVRSLNHRFLDAKVRLPRSDIMSVDMAIRQRVTSQFKRGAIEVHISVDKSPQNANFESSVSENCLNESLLSVYIKAGQRAKQLLPPDVNLSIDQIFRIPGILNWDSLTTNAPATDSPAFWIQYETEIVNKLVDPALNSLKQRRIAEGTKIQAHLLQILDQVQACRAQIGTFRIPERDRQLELLKQRIQSLASLFGSSMEQIEPRLREEAAFLLERRDFEEELMRLGIHLENAFSLLKDGTKSTESLGRHLEFLHQELARETNTLGVKAQSPQITNIIIDIKSSLDRFKEQLANVE